MAETSESYTATVDYPAPILEVFQAAARPGGRRAWWSTDGDAMGQPGSVFRLNWSGGDYIAFRVDAVEAPRLMRWTCIEQVDRNLPEPDEWVGTALRWEFTPRGVETRLEFTHEGLIPRLDCYEACEGGWDFFLRRSLRQLVELGEGAPFRSAAFDGL